MATTIYLIRHGESEANRQAVFLGQGDLGLTQVGLRQARITAGYLKNHVRRPDVIYASDLSRAYDTASCTAEAFDMPIIKDLQLREIDTGLWEGVSFTTLAERYPDSYGVWLRDIGYARCDGGESVEELQQRVVLAVTRIAKKHENSVVFLFTHATPIRVFAAHCLKKTLGEIHTIPWVANASVTKAVYEKGTFRLDEYGRFDFMKGEATELPANV